VGIRLATLSNHKALTSTSVSAWGSRDILVTTLTTLLQGPLEAISNLGI
jgi:hypothetical protein